MKKNLLSLLLAFFCVITVFAQSTEVIGIKRMGRSNSGVLKDGNVIQGYYSLFYLEKADKANVLYGLNIYDNNFKLMHEIELKRPKSQYMLETAFNGDHFCFSFIDTKIKALEYVIFNKEGKPSGVYKVPNISAMEFNMMSAAISSESESYSGGLASVPGKGFLRYGLDKVKGYHSSVEMFDNKGIKKWASTSGVPASQKVYESVFPFYSDQNVAVSMFFSREKLMSMDEMEFFLTFNDMATGKEKFRLASKIGANQKYVHFPIGTTYDAQTEEFYVYGEYYGPNSRPTKDKSLGIYIQAVSKDGKINKQSYSAWSKDVNKLVPAAHKANMTDRNLTIHNIIRTADGNFFVIAEQFKKVASAAGIASKVASNVLNSNSNVSVAQMNMYDMVVFEFSPDLILKNIEVIEKQKGVELLPRGWGMFSSNLLAFLLKTYGVFDYNYTAIAPDAKTFNVGYVNFDREKGESSKYVIGNISYNKQQKLVNDKVRLDTKPTLFSVYPAKPGYMAVFEYFRKEKKISWRLEKLNI